LRVGRQLIEHCFAYVVDGGLVLRDFFHADATMLADRSMRDAAILKQLDQERPRDIQQVCRPNR
jgi:hypothetical protein